VTGNCGMYPALVLVAVPFVKVVGSFVGEGRMAEVPVVKRLAIGLENETAASVELDSPAMTVTVEGCGTFGGSLVGMTVTVCPGKPVRRPLHQISNQYGRQRVLHVPRLACSAIVTEMATGQLQCLQPW